MDPEDRRKRLPSLLASTVESGSMSASGLLQTAAEAHAAAHPRRSGLEAGQVRQISWSTASSGSRTCCLSDGGQ